MNKNPGDLRVLIAEDDFLIRASIRSLVERSGHTVVGEAGTGREAVALAESSRPDVILMDVQMPEMDGLEATRLIQERCPTPVVVVTAYQTPERVERASAAGVGAFLTKPVNARDIESAISISLARFEDMMELRQLNAALQAEITERKRAEEEIRQRNRELAALNAITATMMQSVLHLDEVLQLTADGVVQGLGCNTGFILLLDEKEGVLRGAAVSTSAQILQRLNAIIGFPLLQIKIPARSDFNETMNNLLDGRGTVTHDFYELVRPFWSRRLCSAMQRLLDSKAFFALPLLAKGKTVGGIVASTPEELSEGDTEKLMTFANQAAIAIENARLFEEVQTGQQRARQLAGQIISAQEEERQHLSHEMHDELGQALTAMTLNLTEVEKSLPPQFAPVLREKLAETRSLADETSDHVRELALDLRPSILDDLGLVAALRWYTNRYARRIDVDVELEVTGLEGRLSPEVETTLYRVAQEALTNVARHAQASRVRLHLARRPSSVVALIEDDGRGFDVEEVVAREASGYGAGLMGMRERAALLGGKLDIQSRPGHGTRLSIEIPI